MKFEVDQANTTFFKRYEDLVFRTKDNGLPDGVSKMCSLSFFVQSRLNSLLYLINSIAYYTIFLIIFLKRITLLQCPFDVPKVPHCIDVVQ